VDLDEKIIEAMKKTGGDTYKSIELNRIDDGEEIAKDDEMVCNLN
jgi:hypothetical protein